MNAFNTVNLAAACLLTSTSFAKELGIPQEKWVYVLGGAGTMESANCIHPYLSLKMEAGLKFADFDQSGNVLVFIRVMQYLDP